MWSDRMLASVLLLEALSPALELHPDKNGSRHSLEDSSCCYIGGETSGLEKVPSLSNLKLDRTDP